MLDIFKKFKVYGFSKSLDYIGRELYLLLFSRILKNSYSQDGEDLVIDKLLSYKKVGFYVDVGAHDPTRFSNTKRFYDKGWSGINIDPNPSLLKRFEAARKKDINLCLGVGTKTETMDFYEFFPSTLSTFSAKEAKNYQNQGYKLVNTYKVTVKPLSAVLHEQNVKEIDLLTVDTEGTDLEVLKSNDWKRFKPRVVCVETNKNTQGISEFLASQGYKLKFSNGINSIFSV